MVEQDAPQVVPANEITLLVPYGSLFFATAPLIEAQLPEVTEESRHAVVILNLVKSEDLGSTFLQVLDRYAADLAKQESKLMLASVSAAVRTQLDQTGVMRRIGRENVFTTTDRIGESVLEAFYAADRWLGGQAPRQDDYFQARRSDRERPGRDD
jgi:SulP family sulfate permease